MGYGQNQFAILVILLFLLFSRGLFVLTSILKSLRIIVAFECRLSQNTIRGKLLSKLFSDENWMFILASFFSLLFWGTPFIYLTFLGAQTWYKETMLDEDQISLFGIVENMVEILIIMLMAYLNWRSLKQFEDVKAFISRPYFVYSLWLYGNTVIAYFLQDTCPTYGLLYMWISCLIRSGIMYYLVIIYPIINAVQHRRPFAPAMILNDFNFFIRNPVCSKTFEKYLKTKDSMAKQTLTFWCDISMVLETQTQDDTQLENILSQKQFLEQLGINSE